MLRITDEINEKEYTDFFNKYDNSSILQSYNWYKIKSEWTHTHLAVYDNDKLVLVALMLKRKIAKIFKMGYIARGPVGEVNNKEYLQFFIENITNYAKDCTFFKFDINIKQCSVKLNQEIYIDEYAKEIDKILLDKKYIYNKSEKMHDTIQPRYHANYYHNEKKPFDNFGKNARRDINKSIVNYVEIEKVGIEKLDTFMEFLKDNEKKNDIHLRNKKYFENLLNVYPNNFAMHFAKFNFKKAMNELPDIIDEFEKKAKIENKKQNLNIEKLNSYTSLYKDLKTYHEESQLDEEYIGGVLSLYNDKVCELLYAGSLNKYNRYPSLILAYNSQYNFSFKMGNSIFSMGGIDNSLKDNLFNFKKKFNPNIDVYMGEYDYVFKSIRYKLFKLLYVIKNKI